MKVIVPPPFAKIAACFCHCGSPGIAYQTVLDYLENFSLVDKDWDKRTLELKTGEQYITAYLLTTLGLLEHGGQVGGSWITPEGVQARDFLREYGTSWYYCDNPNSFYSGEMFIGGKNP
jgi:hypothetical protein